MAKREERDRTRSWPEVAIVYVYPVGVPACDDAARRFASTYREYRPLDDHSLHVVFNGEAASDEQRAVFSGIPCEFHVHDNTGWDIGAFQWAARAIECDMIVCFGAFTYFKREGWLQRMREAFREHGDGLYGASASYQISPHVRTAGFWCHPELIRAYPKDVRSYADRYEFEHGGLSLTVLASHLELGSWMVTWDSEYAGDQWRTPPDIFWRGDQSNSLYFDRQFATFDEHPLARPFYAAAADGWAQDPRGRGLGRTRSEWAEQPGTDDLADDPWGFLAREALKELRAGAGSERAVAQMEEELVAELGSDQLAWVRALILERVGIPESLLSSPDVTVAALHSALRLNGFSGEPYVLRSSNAPWRIREGIRVAGLRRLLLSLLQPFADQQRRLDAHEQALLALVSDELDWYRDRIRRLEKR